MICLWGSIIPIFLHHRRINTFYFLATISKNSLIWQLLSYLILFYLQTETSLWSSFWRLQPQLTLKIAWSICRMYLFWSKCLWFVLFVAYVTSAVLRVRWFYQVNTLSEPGEEWSPPPSLLSASLCSGGSRLKRPKKVNTFITKIRFDLFVEEKCNSVISHKCFQNH